LLPPGRHYRIEVGNEPARDHQNRGLEFVERHEHLLGCLRLRHDAHLVFDGENLGDAGSNMAWLSAQNQFQHSISLFA